MDIEYNLQLIMFCLIGLNVYIILTSFFITYTFNMAFLSYNKKLEHIKTLILEIHEKNNNLKSNSDSNPESNSDSNLDPAPVLEPKNENDCKNE